jgi:hypothetical protein
MTRNQRLLAAAAVGLSLTLSACGTIDRMRGGDGSNTGTTSNAECKGLTGSALQDCLDRQRSSQGGRSY